MGKLVISGAGGRAGRAAVLTTAEGAALIDEIETPVHHRTHIGIEAA